MSDDEDLFNIFQEDGAEDPSYTGITSAPKGTALEARMDLPQPTSGASSPRCGVSPVDPQAPPSSITLSQDPSTPRKHVSLIEVGNALPFRASASREAAPRVVMSPEKVRPPAGPAAASVSVAAPPVDRNTGVAAPAVGLGVILPQRSRLGSPTPAFPVTDAAAVLQEPLSGLRVRRVTRSFHLLPVVAAQYPYIPFRAATQALQSSSATLERLCVGAVSRKSEPKQGGHGAYAVLTLWNMEGVSPSSSAELAFCICGAAFQQLNSKLCLGQLIAVEHLTRLGGSKTPSHPKGNENANERSSLLLRLDNPQQVHLLGVAADFSTCEAVNLQTGERCKSLLNLRLSKYCVYHVKQQRSNATLPSAKKVKTAPLFSATSKSKGIQTLMMNRQRMPIVPGSAGLGVSKRIPAPSLFTVSGKTGRPSTSSFHTSPAGTLGGSTQESGLLGGVYSASKGDHLEVSRSVVPLPQQYPSSVSLGVSSRGREALRTAMLTERKEVLQKVLQRAQSGILMNAVNEGKTGSTTRGEDGTAENEGVSKPRKRTRAALTAEELKSFPPTPPHTVRQTTTMVNTALVDSIKAQFTPRDRPGTEHFQPLRSFVQSSSGSRMTPSKMARVSSHTPSALLRTVALDVSKQMSQRALLSTGESSSAKPLLVSIAEQLNTSHSDLVEESRLKQLQQQLQSFASREEAYRVLDQVTEEEVQADYCAACQSWHQRVPDSCKSAGHHVERRGTKKHHIRCSFCGLKTFILGDSREAFRVLPRCPRCSASNCWQKGSAAPELKGSFQKQEDDDGDAIGSCRTKRAPDITLGSVV